MNLWVQSATTFQYFHRGQWKEAKNLLKNGIVFESSTLGEDRNLIYQRGKIIIGPADLHVIDIDTGELLANESCTSLPEWAKEPLLREMKLAEFRRQVKKKRKSK